MASVLLDHYDHSMLAMVPYFCGVGPDNGVVSHANLGVQHGRCRNLDNFESS